ncbi:MAG: hypothetical protein KDA54_09375 [Phycisphaerales bacterium]|nr:hypothetical protein [Phycisphaerales bacterium]
MESSSNPPMIRNLAVDIQADPVLGPDISYGPEGTVLCFPTPDDRFGRITFEKLDALRMCRGEYDPYKRAGQFSWVSVVENSPWLIDRYDYESRHYKNAYEFCGDVDEMLRDFSHYFFSFHDEFVEAIAAGIWIEAADEPFSEQRVVGDHPLLPLPENCIAERIQVGELICQVRQSTQPSEQLLSNARLCSQPLLQFALELDGEADVSWRLNLRQRNGKPISQLVSFLGRIEAEFDGIACLDDVRSHVEKWMQGVCERRRALGK